MEIKIMLLHPDRRNSVKTVNGYNFNDMKDVAVHRDIFNASDWRVTDIKSGSTFGFIETTKKKATEYFISKGYVEKLAAFRETAKYTKTVEAFEKAKAELAELETNDE